MSNEIKVGDKVRVREDAPRMYLRTMSTKFLGAECEVFEIIDGNAAIASGRDYIAIPLKYLVKVDAEAKEPKYKYQVGQKVKSAYANEILTIKERCGRVSHDNVYKVEEYAYTWNECELQPYTEPAEEEFKVGSLVIIKQSVDLSKLFSVFKRMASTVKEISNDKVTLAINRLGIQDLELTDVPLEYIEKVDAIEYHRGHAHGYTVTSQEEKESEYDPAAHNVMPAIAYWNAYTADLAKEVALKVANKFNTPKEVAEYAVSVAQAVVEGLKRK